jgi:hypothetical protein
MARPTYRAAGGRANGSGNHSGGPVSRAYKKDVAPDRDSVSV